MKLQVKILLGIAVVCLFVSPLVLSADYADYEDIDDEPPAAGGGGGYGDSGFADAGAGYGDAGGYGDEDEEQGGYGREAGRETAGREESGDEEEDEPGKDRDDVPPEAFLGSAVPQSYTQEELAEDARVPPPKPNGDPAGHMEFLGSHRPMGKIPVLNYMPSPEEFWTNYVHAWRPVILRGAAKNTTAYKKWTKEYMEKKWGDQKVRCETKIENRDDPNYGPYTTNLSAFFKDYETSTAYAVSVLPHEMAREVEVPECMLCGDRDASHIKEPNGRRYLTLMEEAGLWISSQTTRSQLHYDELNIMNCLFKGAKEWRMINTHRYVKNIPMVNNNFLFLKSQSPATKASDYSKINVTHVDMKKYPKMQHVTVDFGMQEEGDCLFIPYAYLHQVSKVTTDFSVAASIMVRRTERFTKDGCKGAPLTRIPLSAFDMTWFYAGKGVVPMGYPDPMDLQQSLNNARKKIAVAYKGLTDATQKRRASIRSMFSSLKGDTEDLDPIMLKKLATKWVDRLDKDKSGYLTDDELTGLDRGTLCALAVDVDLEETKLFDPEFSYVKKPEDEISLGNQILTKVEQEWAKSHPAGTTTHSEL